MASDRPKRKAIPERVKLASTLIAAGMHPAAAADLAARLGPGARGVVLSTLLGVLDVADAEYDHSPPLGLRPVNAAGDDYDPPQLDPRHITPRAKADHRTKTSGTPAGQKVVTVANGDIHRIAKAKRLEEARLTRFEHTEVRMVLGEGEQSRKQSQPWPKGRKMQSRPFPKKHADG